MEDESNNNKITEIIEWKNEILHEILEEFSKGKDLDSIKFIEFLIEYDRRPIYTCAKEESSTEEEPEKKKDKEEKKKLIEEEKICVIGEQIEELKEALVGKKTTTQAEFMNYLLDKIDVVMDEKEILQSFEIFDRFRHSEIVVGTIPLSDIKMIMEQYGPLGYQLNEYEQAKFWRLLKDQFEYLNNIHAKLDWPTVEVIEYVHGQRHVNYVKDKEINYAEFTRKLLASVTSKESGLRGAKEKEDTQIPASSIP